MTTDSRDAPLARRILPQLRRPRKETRIRGQSIGFDTRSPHNKSAATRRTVEPAQKSSQIAKLVESAMHREQTMFGVVQRDMVYEE